MAKRSFEEWMSAVDRILLDKVSMVALDLPDIDYRDMYDDGRPPSAAANKAIREAGGF